VVAGTHQLHDHLNFKRARKFERNLHLQIEINKDCTLDFENVDQNTALQFKQDTNPISCKAILAGPKEENMGEEKKGSSSRSSFVKKKNNQNCFVFFGFCQDLQYLHSWKCNTYPDQKDSVIHTFFFSGLDAIVAELDQKNNEKKRSTVVDLPLGPCCLLAFLSPMDR
jgi:hypothetical protein